MKADMPHYLSTYADKSLPYKNMQDIMDFNLQDTSLRIPYGQARLDGIMADSTSAEDFTLLKARLHE